MKKVSLFVIVFLCVVSLCSAQSRLHTLLNGVTSTGDGTAVTLAKLSSTYTCSTTWAGTTPTSYSVILKGSIDGTTYGDFATYTATVPTEKLANGTFTGNATGWTLASGFTYSSNTVVKDGNGTGTLSQAVGDMTSAPVVGERYILRFTISSWSVGTVTPAVGGATGTAVGADGTYEQIFVATSAASGVVFTPTNTARFTIDSISLIKVGQIFHVVNKEANYIKGSYLSKVGGSTDTAITLTCTAGGN